MEHIIQLETAAPSRPSDVIALRCPYGTNFDPLPLQTLTQNHGEVETEVIICGVLEDIATRLDLLQSELAQSGFDKMIQPARRIGQIGDQIGLTEVSIAARHVATCLEQADGVALEATVARLERAFDIAVSDVWNFRDM